MFSCHENYGADENYGVKTMVTPRQNPPPPIVFIVFTIVFKSP